MIISFIYPEFMGKNSVRIGLACNLAIPIPARGAGGTFFKKGGGRKRGGGLVLRQVDFYHSVVVSSRGINAYIYVCRN